MLCLSGECRSTFNRIVGIILKDTIILECLLQGPQLDVLLRYDKEARPQRNTKSPILELVEVNVDGIMRLSIPIIPGAEHL